MNDFDLDAYLVRSREGDQQALGELFTHFYPRLRRMVEVRLDQRLRGRIDPSDVLQEAYVDVAKDSEKYFRDEKIPFFLWLRLMTGRRLMNTHRMHLGAKMRDAGREISMHYGGVPGATSVSLAERFAGTVTSASRAAVRNEAKSKLEDGLNSMEELDREILVLRHLEDMTNQEAATCLGLTKTAASNRYIRALKRLNTILSDLQDWTIG